MRHFLCCVLVSLWPCFALAGVGVVVFKVHVEGRPELAQTYKVVMYDGTMNQDTIYRMVPSAGDQGPLDKWQLVYRGHVGLLQLPWEATIESEEGRNVISRARYPIEKANYSLVEGPEGSEGGLRLYSNRKLIWITRFGAAQITWAGGAIVDLVRLDHGFDGAGQISFMIFSVRGSFGSATYIVTQDHFSEPTLIDNRFHSRPLGAKMEQNGDISIEALQKKITPPPRSEPQSVRTGRVLAHAPTSLFIGTAANRVAPKASFAKPIGVLFPPPTAKQVMKELVAQLDQREPLASLPQAPELAARSIRGMLLSEFPQLRELQEKDLDVLYDIDQLVKSLTHLWLNDRISGTAIHNTLLTRLEAFVENRTQCELSLRSFIGGGSHAASFYQDEAQRAMDDLYEKLYRIFPE